jgi:hypothetical protein
MQDFLVDYTEYDAFKDELSEIAEEFFDLESDDEPAHVRYFNFSIIK